MRSTTIRRAALAAAVAITVAACGGSDSESDAEPAVETDAADDTEPTDGDTDDELFTEDDDPEGAGDAGDDAPADESGDSGDADTDDESTSSGTYEPGPIGFRAVNLLDQPVDLYVRTTGLVEGFPVEMSVGPGAVTGYANPPAEGKYIVTVEGGGDPTCVVDCDHFIAELSGAFGEGAERTVILYDDPFDGPRAFELSNTADSVESAATSSNLLRPADPSTGIVFPVGIALDDDVFGFQVGFVGVDGCVEAPDNPSILVGGNQTPWFPYPGDAAELLFFEISDQECTDPVSAPIPIAGGPGTRTLVVLSGAPPALESVVLPLDGDVAPTSATDETTGDDGDAAAPTTRDEFVTLLLDDAPDGTDPQCVADVIDQLSDADFTILIENLDADDIPPEFSDEGLATLESILDCAPA